MHFDLRYAGLDPAMERRLRLAANALAAHRLTARASEWDGTRCDVVAADPDDEYGRRVLEIARRRGTPVLEVGTATRTAELDTTVARLTRALYGLLRAGGDDSPSMASANPAVDANACGLVRLAGDDALVGKDVEARIRNVVVWLLPESGRVLSATVSDQLHARERLCVGWDWTFVPLVGKHRDKPPGEISTSLDAFLVHAAWQARAQLPAFPSRDVALRDWPDLGAAASLVEPLAVVRALQRGPTTVTQIARRSGIAEADVGACLWAFKAAGLLHDRAAVTLAPEVARPQGGGLFARLASHFGLFRS